MPSPWVGRPVGRGGAALQGHRSVTGPPRPDPRSSPSPPDQAKSLSEALQALCPDSGDTNASYTEFCKATEIQGSPKPLTKASFYQNGSFSEFPSPVLADRIPLWREPPPSLRRAGCFGWQIPEPSSKQCQRGRQGTVGGSRCRLQRSPPAGSQLTGSQISILMRSPEGVGEEGGRFGAADALCSDPPLSGGSWASPAHPGRPGTARLSSCRVQALGCTPLVQVQMASPQRRAQGGLFLLPLNFSCDY